MSGFRLLCNPRQEIGMSIQELVLPGPQDLTR